MMERQRIRISKIVNAPIIVAIIGVILTVFLSTQKTELRYTLSEEIPIYLTTEKNQNVQQLVIKNTGDALAEKIVIDINGRIEKYSIINYSKTDVVEEFVEEKNLQIVYPELPKQGVIQITFISEQKIQDTDIEIKYNRGLAKEALSSDMDPHIFLILCYIVIIGLIIGGIYKTITDFDVKLYYQKYLKRRRKYWYISHEHWEDLRKKSIIAWQEKLLEETTQWYYIKNITSTHSFKILNEKPEYLINDEWEIVRDTAEKSWSILQREFLLSHHVSIDKEFGEYLKIEKPKYLAESEWRKSRENVLDMIKFGKMKYYDSEGIEKAYYFLNQKKESYFSEKEWKKLVNITFAYLRDKFYERLNEIREYDVEKLEKYFVMVCPLSVDKNEWKDMQIDIYKSYINICIEMIRNKVKYYYFSEAIELMNRPCPPNLPEEFWKQYSDSSKNIIESYLVKYIYEYDGSNDIESIIHNYDLSIINQNRIETVLYDVLSSKLILKSMKRDIEQEEIPHWVKERKFTELENYLVLKAQLESLLEKNKTEAIEVGKLKERITKQLELVNAVLRDPTVLNYIEDYSDIFSTGNFENLKKVAGKLVTENPQSVIC